MHALRDDGKTKRASTLFGSISEILIGILSVPRADFPDFGHPVEARRESNMSRSAAATDLDTMNTPYNLKLVACHPRRGAPNLKSNVELFKSASKDLS